MLILLFATFIFNSVFAQIDSVNTQSNTLNTEQLSLEKKTYVVYLQDSLNGIKYNFEIWNRIITKDKSTKNSILSWTRHQNVKGNYYQYQIRFDDQLNPLTEQVVYQQKKGNEIVTKKKHYIYKNGSLYTSQDTTLHNTKEFRLQTLNHSFNWELDLETLSSLPLKEKKTFAINFYHPGSKTLPQYYNFTVDRSEILSFNKTSFNCWVVKVVYSKHQSSEFWIDKDTHTVLQMKEEFYGKYRFKKLVI